MPGPVTLTVASAPALLPAYLKLMVTRKPRLVEGTLARFEAEQARFAIDRRHLARYQAVCGAQRSDEVPVAYPHALATPLHLAMMTTAAFPISPVGAVHVRNHIEVRRPLRVGDRGSIHCMIDGHRETAFGQELDLHTELRVDGEVAWLEVCTLLARRVGKTGAPRGGGPVPHRVSMPEGPLHKQDFEVDTQTGRRYARASGDFNPIHVADFAARFFGFKSAVAHGMWALARCIAGLEPEVVRGACTVDVAFKRPIFFPSRLVLENCSDAHTTGFALRDGTTGRGHLLGTVRR